MRLAGVAPVTMGLRDLSAGVDPARLLGGIFFAARTVTSYSVLVIIYFGFLVASRAAFGRKLEALYESDGQRISARRVMGAVSNAVERYVRLQTLKALMMAIVATGRCPSPWAFTSRCSWPSWSSSPPMCRSSGPIIGSLVPGLVALAQFQADLPHPAITVAVLGGRGAAPDRQRPDSTQAPPATSSDIDNPLLVLISIGFWGAILGRPRDPSLDPSDGDRDGHRRRVPEHPLARLLLLKDGHPISDGAAAGP